jgi:hypothetical protein
MEFVMKREIMLGAAFSAALIGCSTETTETQSNQLPEILEAQVCLQIGSPDVDPIIYNIDNADEFGHHDIHREMEYDGETNTWFMDNVPIGTAENEDDPFNACGERSFMEVLLTERDWIDQSGD